MNSLTTAYTHCPLCGSPDFLQSDRGKRCCGSCGHQEFNNPIAAVGALILDDQQRLLLIRRAREPSLGMLAMPGGFVDAGESLEQALHREIEEEIGLPLVDIRYLCSYPNDYVYRGLTRPVCDVFFEARTPNFDVVIQESEVSSWEMQGLAAIDPGQLAFPSMQEALRCLREKRRYIGRA